MATTKRFPQIRGSPPSPRGRERLIRPRTGNGRTGMAAIDDETAGGPLQALVDRGEQRGCIELSEIDELVQTSGIEDDDLGRLYEALDARGGELRDNCGREAEEAPVNRVQLASATTDALQLFLNEIGRHRLLTPAEEIDLAKR